MSKTKAIAVGGLVVVGVIGYLCYRAYQKGREVGHSEGYQQATQRYESEITDLKNSLSAKENELKTTRELLRQQIEQTTIRDAEITELKEEIKRLSKNN